MNLRQQIIQDRVEEIVSQLNVPEDMAFLRLSHSLMINESLHSFHPADFVDGGGDKQIDVITIHQVGQEANIYILQMKKENGFSSNSLIQMKNGLNWTFNKTRADIASLKNVKLKDKILEYRSVQSELGPSNINIIIGFITNGESSRVSDEFIQEVKTISDQYDNNTFSSFKVHIWGADELVEQINRIERTERKIDADIPIRYDTNNPSLIKYHAEGLKGLICTVSAYEIAEIVNNDPEGYVFDANIRRFKGKAGAVNRDIYNTCSSLEEGYQFWFLNNGITIVCDNFDPVTDPDNPHIKIKNLQIVNGCQTASTLALAAKDKKLPKDVRVLLRIYETAEISLVDKIVLTTNNQNRITARDLRANDSIQFDMERGFRKYNYYYERKSYQYKKKDNVSVKRIVVNELVAQSYLAIVLRKIADASRRKYKVWGDYYEQIFGRKMIIEPYIISVLIYKYTSVWLHEKYGKSSDDLLRKLANNGAFHVARMGSYLWKGDDNWRIEETELLMLLRKIEEEPKQLDKFLEEGFMLLVNIIKQEKKYLQDIDVALKSSNLDSDVDACLYA